jgi:hypothetical protein
MYAIPQDPNRRQQMLKPRSFSFLGLLGILQSLPVKELKKALQNLKSNKGDLSEIKYVSRTLRDKLRNNNNDGLTPDSNESFNHDNYIGRNFWGYIKNVINKKDSILPSFNVTDCFTYFTKSLAKINNCLTFPAGFQSYLIPKFNSTLTPRLTNKLLM